MTGEWLTSAGRSVATWLTVGTLVTIAALAGIGYRATREWHRSSTLLVDRRAEQAANLLATALARDMRGVHTNVLDHLHRDDVALDSPQDLADLVSVALARYPYPESFFSWRFGAAAHSAVIFNRADRWPRWMPPFSGTDRYPVVLVREAAITDLLKSRVENDTLLRRRYSTFETCIGGEPYQVIARILYRDPLREYPESVVGFTVNLQWVRQHYFGNLTAEVARISDERGLDLAVLDHDGTPVVNGGLQQGGPVRIRRFPLFFFDPALVALDRPADLRLETWTVQVSGARDPMLTTASRGLDWTLIVIAIAAVALTVSLIITVQAVRAGVALATMRSDFVSTVTHELKTPLATIRAVGETLGRGRLGSADTLKEYARVLVEEAKRLTRLVDNLLAYARVTDLTEVYAFEPQAPAELVDDAVQGFTQQLTAGGFGLELDVPTDLPPVRADRTAVSLLLDNLIDNAIRYAGEHRWLRISARYTEGWVRIAVEDRGSGIPPDELEHVQRRFYRGRLTSRSQGSGLGLAIASRIAADHGGTLTLSSQVGVGTTVTLTLPAAVRTEDVRA